MARASMLPADRHARFLAVGTPEDRRAFAAAIRAFALAGKWGDRLALVGYGAHRHGLETWCTALKVDRAVTFAKPDGMRLDATDLPHFDVAILFSPDAERIAAVLREPGDGAAPRFQVQRQAAVRSDDVCALAHALVKLRPFACAAWAGVDSPLPALP